MRIAWDDSFILGIDEIDKRHRTILEQYGRLSVAARQGGDRFLLDGMINFFLYYIQEHFQAEEQFMAKYHYPLAADEHREHERFGQDIAEFKRHMEKQGMSHQLVSTFMDSLVIELVEHIRTHDRPMADFVRQRMATTH
jgi:hemerythrin-like metal-binding protein